MAIARGTINSATAATDFVLTVLRPALMAAGWKFIKAIENPTARHGYAAGASAEVWCAPSTRVTHREGTPVPTGAQNFMNPLRWNQSFREAMASDGVTAATATTLDESGIFDYELDGNIDDFYDQGLVIVLEIDNTNARIRFRAMEGFDAEFEDGIFPIGGSNAGASVTPSVNYATSGATAVDRQSDLIGTGTASYAWVNIAVANNAIIPWLLEVTATRITIGSFSGGTTSGGVIGFFTPVVTAYDWHTPIVLLATASSQSWTEAASNRGGARFSRAPGHTVGTTGPGAGHVDFVTPHRVQNSTPFVANPLGETNATKSSTVIPKGFTDPLAGDVWFWGTIGVSEGYGPKGYMTDLLIFPANTTPIFGDTLELYRTGDARHRSELIPAPKGDTALGLPPVDDEDFEYTQNAVREQYLVLGMIEQGPGLVGTSLGLAAKRGY